jgi:hypothetical protein
MSEADRGHDNRRHLHSQHKRHRSAPGGSSEDADAEGIELVELRDLTHKAEQLRITLHSPIHSKVGGVFNMMVSGERERLAAEIWTADFFVAMKALREANPELVDVLRSQITNTTTVTEQSRTTKMRQLDGILLNVVRAQNIHMIPLLTAALSILCEANLIKREFHDAITFLMKGALMSETWVQDFMPLAARARPTPTDVMIAGIMVVCFDNLTMNVAYHSYSVGGATGEKLDMTNWFAVRIPAFLSPHLDDGMKACMCKGKELAALGLVCSLL